MRSSHLNNASAPLGEVTAQWAASWHRLRSVWNQHCNRATFFCGKKTPAKANTSRGLDRASWRWGGHQRRAELRSLVRSRNGLKQNCTLPPARHEVQDRKVCLNLAIYVTGLAIRLQLGIIDCLAGHLLDCAFHFLRRSGDPVRHDDVFLQDQAKAPERATCERGCGFSFPLVSNLA